MELLILDSQEVKQCVTYQDALDAAEIAFRAYAQGGAVMPSKVYLPLEIYQGDLRAMPAYLKDLDICGIKWVNSHPANQALGLPTVMALVILNNPKTGQPIAMMDGTHLTSMRTGSAGALASQCMAPPDAAILALVGSGVQAHYQLRAHMEIFSLKEVRVWSGDAKSANTFLEAYRDSKITIRKTETIRDCVQGAHIICTTTPSTQALLQPEDLTRPVHINAIGADAPGKQELDPRILKQAAVVVDDWLQASHGGEINQAVAKGLFSKEDLYCSLGDLVIGKKSLSADKNRISVFDSTGLAIQDMALAKMVYMRAREQGLGKAMTIA
ncbi:MAG: ornithine cyclodeaminase family protein [Chlamydiota bacterium]|nr:ornithine cyclodeaminase family protein [Chlamydiota bacterium]